MHDDGYSSTNIPQDTGVRESRPVSPISTPARSTPVPERQSADDGSFSHDGVEGGNKPKPPAPSIRLQRSVYMVFLIVLYGAATLYAWATICILTYRPIGGTSYGLGGQEEYMKTGGLGTTVTEHLNSFFAKTERHLRAARIVQSIVSVLIIPLTSAVCSQAAVVYLQQKRGDNRPTLRQSMALADKGWADIELLSKLFFGGWNKYRSSLLLFALFLNLLGAAIFPVQQLFLSYKTIKRPDYAVGLVWVTDFTDLFPESGPADYDNGENTAQLRASMASTLNTNVQPRLWSLSNGTVSVEEKGSIPYRSAFQSKSQNSLTNISTITDPFWAQVPSDTNTGMHRQFAPRINSTAKWENNAEGSLPEECNPSSDAFYLHYEYEYEDLFQYNVEICMPGNMSKSPWENKMSRQDMHEELYLKMNFSGDFRGLVPRSGEYSRKVTLDTTTGYFELPNYANGQAPGPLIEEDPFDDSTFPQYSRSERLDARDLNNDTAWATLNATRDLTEVGNKGPLTNIAMALFGEGSFVDVQHTTLAAYSNSGVIYDGCLEVVPFVPLLRESIFDDVGDTFDPCIKGNKINDDGDHNDARMHAVAAAYFGLFAGDALDERVQNGFASAAFLANDVIMSNYRQSPRIDVSYDMGVDVQIPYMSRAGIIFISTLLGIDLACLLALGIYSACIPRWTDKLDSFALLRIGASISERVPLLAARHAGRIKTLDETPGWIGNASDGEIGELRLGGKSLRKRRAQHFYCYSTDHKVLGKEATSKSYSRVAQGEDNGTHS